MELPNIYKGNYKRLVIIPIVLVLVALFFIPGISPGIEFKGGVQITFETPQLMDDEVLEQAVMDEGFVDYTVKTYVLGDINIAEIEIGHSDEILEVETTYREFLTNYDAFSKLQYELLLLKGSNMSHAAQERELNELHEKLIQNRDDFERFSEHFLGVKTVLPSEVDVIKPDIEDLYSKIISSYRGGIISKFDSHIDYTTYSFKLINPSLSEIFMEKIQSVMIIAGILMAITVYLLFRDIYPTVTVLLGVLFDVAFALGAMGLLGIPLSLASIAAILMLVGYSVDTNILLTIRVLKRGLNNPRDSAHDAMKTGVMLTLTGILSFFALFMVSQITNIATYQTISLVVLFGLMGDLVATWMLNAVLIIHRVEGVKDA
jgi:preprotein translocase subunit SecF